MTNRAMPLQRLDHIALRAADRPALARELEALLDIQVLDETDRLTLLGPDMSSGKITLLDAAAGALLQHQRIVSIVLSNGDSDVAAPPITSSTGLVFTFARADAAMAVSARHSVVGMTLRSIDPPVAAAELVELYGFTAGSMQRDVATVHVGDVAEGGWITLVREEDNEEGVIQALDHIGVHVANIDSHRTELQSAGVVIDREVEGAVSHAIFVTGPEGLVIEYIQQTAE